jgi:hypothetical protein
MFDQISFGIEFFEELRAIDEEIVHEAAKGRCRWCGGPLHRGDHPRKPRGGQLGSAGEQETVRFNLCCGREGCRRRAMPPSVRFLGRRVYLGAVVIAASVVAMAMSPGAAARRVTGIAARTTRRWLQWWRGSFVQTAAFMALASRLIPVVDRRLLPLSLLVRLADEPHLSTRRLLAWLAPLTTGSMPDGSRFVRAAM